MFQCKIDKIFSDMPNVFGIVDHILVTGYNENGADHDAAVHKVLQQCEEVNLKLNKEKCHFRCTSIPFFGEVISWDGVPNNKKELQAFLGIINYLGKFSPGTTNVCDPLCKLTSGNDDTKSLYLETDTSRVGLGVALLQMCEGTTCQKDIAPNNPILHPIAYASKSPTGAEYRYNNIEREALGILHGLKKIHHCFARKVLIITNHKPLESIFKKDVAPLLQCIQCILLKIHQYRVQIMYNLSLRYSLLTGCHETTTKKGRTSPSKIWI